jgi:colicin import membrane protein
VVAATAAAFFVLGSQDSEKASRPSVAAAEPLAAAPAIAAPTVAADANVPAKIQVRIETEPAGVSVYNALTGVNLGKTPYRDERPRAKGALELMLKLEGYESQVVSVPLQEDFSESVALVATETAAVATKGRQASKKPDKRSRPSAAEVKAAKAAEKRIKEEKARQAAAAKAAAKKAAAAKAAAKKPEPKWGELAD